MKYRVYSKLIRQINKFDYGQLKNWVGSRNGYEAMNFLSQNPGAIWESPCSSYTVTIALEKM